LADYVYYQYIILLLKMAFQFSVIINGHSKILLLSL